MSFFSKSKEWLLKHPLAILFLIFGLSLLVRSTALWFDSSVDPDSHFHARLSDEIVRTGELPHWDFLSMQGRAYSYPPLLHVLTAVLSLVTGVKSLTILMYLGLMIGSFFCVSVFLLAWGWSKSYAIGLAAALFAGTASIAVWRTTGFIRPDGIALTLIPFLLFLWLTHRNRLAFFMSLGLVLLHPLSAAVYGVLLALWAVIGFVQKKVVSFWMVFSLVGMLLVFLGWVHGLGLPISEYVHKLSLDASEFSRFWVLDFILFFPLFWALAFFGIWKEKLPASLIVSILATLALGALGVRLVLYSIPFLAIAAGYGLKAGLSYLQNEPKAVKVLVFFLLVLGLITVYVLLSNVHPYNTPSERSAIQFLKEYSIPNQGVLTIWDQGHVLAYYTKLPQVIDGYFEFAPQLDERNSAMQDATSTSRCATFLSALDRFRATYFYLPRDELNSVGARLGALELERCPGVRVPFSSDGARLFERV